MVKSEILINIRGNNVSFYQKQGQYELMTLDGLNVFACSDITQDVPVLLERFADKLNLESAASISAIVHSIDGSAIIQKVINSIREKTSCSNCAELDYLRAISNVISDLKSEESLEVDYFGINYGAKNYKAVNGVIQDGPFNLLAFTVSDRLLVEHIDH